LAGRTFAATTGTRRFAGALAPTGPCLPAIRGRPDAGPPRTLRRRRRTPGTGSGKGGFGAWRRGFGRQSRADPGGGPATLQAFDGTNPGVGETSAGETDIALPNPRQPPREIGGTLLRVPGWACDLHRHRRPDDGGEARIGRENQAAAEPVGGERRGRAGRR